MPSHAAASRPRAQNKIKSTSRRKRRAPFWPKPGTAYLPAPAKATPPRPEGPEQPRFKRDVVTRNQSRCSLSRGKLTVHARKRLTALTRRYSPSAASGLDVLTPTAHVTIKRDG